MANYQFESLEFDANKRELTGPQGSSVLRQKVADTLTLLLDRATRVVSQEEFLEKVWPGTHVDDRALPQVMAELRSALETAGGQRDWVRTIPKAGYVLDLQVVSVTAPLPLMVQSKANTRTRFPKWTYPLAAFILLLVTWKLIPGREKDDSLNRHAIALLPFKNLSGDPALDWMGLGFLDILRSHLQPAIDVTDPVVVVAEARRLNLVDLPLDPSSHQEIQRSLGEPLLVSGTILKRGGQMALQLHFLDGAQLDTIEVEPFDPPYHAGAIADVIARKMQLHTKPFNEYAFSEPYVRKVFAEGLEQYLWGSIEPSISFFEVVHTQDPDFWWGGYYLACGQINLSRFEASFAILNDLILKAPSHHQQHLARLALGELFYEKRDFDSAHATFSNLLKEPDLNELGRAKSLQVLGIMSYAGGSYDEAADQLGQALQLYRERRDPRGEVSTLRHLSTVAQLRHLPSESLGYLEDALPIARALANEAIESSIYLSLGDHYYLVQDYKKAETHYQAALEIRRRLGDKRGEAMASGLLGGTLIMLKRFDESEQLIQRSIEGYTQTQDSYNLVNQQLNAGYLSLVQRHWEQANQRYQQAVQGCLAVHDEQGLVYALIGLCEVSLQAGDLVRASEHLRRALNTNAAEQAVLQTRLLHYEAALDYLQGRPDMALDKIIRARDLSTSESWTNTKQQYLDIYRRAATGGHPDPLPFVHDPFLGPDP